MKGYLGDRGLYIELLRLGLPISLQSLIAVGMSMIDTVMLGSMGDAQLAAVSEAGQYVTQALVAAMAVGMGASVLTNRFWGMGDLRSLKQTVTVMLRWELGVAVVFTVVGLVLPRQIMGLFTKDPSVTAYGMGYLRQLLPVYTAMAFSQGCTIVLRSAGALWVPLLASAGALGVNGLGNWVLIFGNWGAPRMEIVGAGLATTLGWLFQLGVTCGYFFFAEKKIGYRFQHKNVGDGFASLPF